MQTRSYPTQPGTPAPSTVPLFALHLLHGWWVASCPDCGHELGRSRDQEAAERAGERAAAPSASHPSARPGGGLMAGCDVLYYDPAHVDRDPAGPLTRPAMAGSRVERPATSG
jgi:hypothetical protein